jgi:DNA repair protein RadC
LNVGFKALGDDELLAILLRTGYKNTSAKELALNILNSFNNLNDIDDLTVNQITKVKGVGLTKAITILAALEFGKRFSMQKENVKIKLNNSLKVYNYLKYKFTNRNQEEFVAILLDNKKNLIDSKIIFKGDLNSVNIHPREIFKYAIVNSSANIIIAHNHPSGDVFPSKKDIFITKELMQIGSLVQIPVIDHIIVGKNNYYSFFESEVLNDKDKQN